MKKRILSLSIAAMIGGVGLAGGASAAVFSQGAGTLTNVGNAAGNILLVPYFSTQGGNATLLNITNTDTVNGKAVKVRFRGAANSDDLYDFQVLLSPGDVWTASVSQDATTGISTLSTTDATCTLPTSVNGTFQTGRVQQFSTASSIANQTREGYIEILNMADIPKFGLFDQGTVSGTTITAPTTNPLYTAIKHVNGVAPCSTNAAGAAAINLLVQDPTTYSATVAFTTGAAAAGTIAVNTKTASLAATSSSSAQGLGLVFPTGKLLADWTIINVASTTVLSGQATAIAADTANLVFFPQVGTAIPTTNSTAVSTVAIATGTAATLATPTLDAVTADPIFRTTNLAYNQGTVLANANVNNGTAANNANGTIQNAASSTAASLASPAVAAAYYDQPDLSTPYVGVVLGGATATANVSALNQSLTVTALLAKSSVTNSYLTTSALNAATDWVFSMPTRRYHTAYAYSYAGATGNGQIYTDYTKAATVTGAGATGSAYRFFSPSNTSVSTTNGLQICTKLATGVTAFGREEQVAAVSNPGFVVSPGTVAASATLSLCGETSVLSFGKASALLSATVANTVYPAASLPAVDGWATFGTSSGAANVVGTLPILGFAAQKAVNSAVSAGVSGNFGLSYTHR
ncbi:hypothetical protein [Curvibacter gracilis]|uniref:hypothetical protein n=1 Tax=Curvibacter gracilis TaxID=230310 RepID=UPI000484EFB3|nr:hypothetical protein [Curvibacter gracilis]